MAALVHPPNTTTGDTIVKKAYLFLSMLTLAGAANAGLWNACDDFSITNGNPNGQWSYGSKLPSDLGGGFVGAYVAEENTLFKSWHAERIDGGAPAVSLNISDHTVAGIDPGELCVHPGSSALEYQDYLNQVATVRWTAPEAGTYSIWGMFGEGDRRGSRGDVDVYIYKNGSCLMSVFGTYDDEYFDLFESLAKGDTIDFMVGNAGDFGWDSTPLYATISTVPEPFSLVILGGGALIVALRRRRS
jgi:hypothetical protein